MRLRLRPSQSCGHRMARSSRRVDTRAYRNPDRVRCAGARQKSSLARPLNYGRRLYDRSPFCRTRAAFRVHRGFRDVTVTSRARFQMCRAVLDGPARPPADRKTGRASGIREFAVNASRTRRRVPPSLHQPPNVPIPYPPFGGQQTSYVRDRTRRALIHNDLCIPYINELAKLPRTSPLARSRQNHQSPTPGMSSGLLLFTVYLRASVEPHHHPPPPPPLSHTVPFRPGRPTSLSLRNTAASSASTAALLSITRYNTYILLR